MEAALTALLAPYLAQLLPAGEAIAGKLAGTAAATLVQTIWGKLRTKVEAREASVEAAQDVAQRPDDPRARSAFELQLEKLLRGDPALAEELKGMLEKAKQDGVIAGDGSVVIGGDVRADRGSVASARDITVHQGGLHTGWKRADDGEPVQDEK